MNKIIPSVIEDNGEYYIHIEEYKTLKQLVEHYEHLYSEVKKQKDDVVEIIKRQLLSNTNITKYTDEMCLRHVLRMLGEINE